MDRQRKRHARQFHDVRESARTAHSNDRTAKTVVQLRRPAISTKVIRELLRLGYLQPAKRYKPHVVERALARLRADLVRDGVVKGSNSLADPIAPAADNNQPAASGPGAST
jgi:hypothetical protein